MGNVMADTRETALAAAELIQDAGGEVVGKTRIQKAAFFLESMGLGRGFEFYYKHYGPFSDELASALHFARELGLTMEENKKAAWGGAYTVFRSEAHQVRQQNEARTRVLQIARDANPVALELAATALFLRKEGAVEPWSEVKNLKPTKATADNLKLAKKLYADLSEVNAPSPLPAL
jgi:uncharacterized protein YwgA